MFRPFSASVALVVALVLGSGCASPLKLSATSTSPSTDAWLTVTGDANNNSILQIKVEHLPPPGRLASSLKTYVVWVMSTDGAFVTNVGMLQVSGDQKGSITTTTPLREFIVRITAEEAGTVVTPGAIIVAEGGARR